MKSVSQGYARGLRFAAPSASNSVLARVIVEGVWMDLTEKIRTIPDFPKPGIMFRDVTTLFGDAEAFRTAVARLVAAVEPLRPDLIAGIEARGFILGGAMAEKLGVGFAPVRKAGKLPFDAIAEDYDLEYGSATLEMHVDAAAKGARVAIVDDLIATGGTGLAAIALVRRLSADPVAFAAVIDLPDLGGAARIEGAGVPVHALTTFSGH